MTSLIAVGALLPLAAWGQTSTPPDTHKGGLAADKPGANAREDHTSLDVNSSDARQDPASPHHTPNRTNPPSRAGARLSDSGASTGLSGSVSAQQIQRVSSEQLDQRVTASSLVGKKVVDREGQEIGKVKDVGLTNVAPQLASGASATGSSASTSAAAQSGGGLRQQGASSASISDSTSPGLRPADTTVDGRDRQEDAFLAEQRLRREVDRAGTAGSDKGLAASSQGDMTSQSRDRQARLSQSAQQEQQASAGGQPRILVQPERSLGLSGDLVAIPASQVHREGDTLRVDMSREELRAIVAQQPRASSVSLAE